MNARHGNSDPLGGLIFFVVFFGFAIIIAIISHKLEQKRRKEIENYCKINHLVYSDVVGNIPIIASNFSLINQGGHSVQYYAGMSGNRSGINFNIFDYKYTKGSGKNSHTYHYMICILSKNNLNMPQFFVRTENFLFDSLGKLFGGQDINFTEDPTFSKTFVLQGKSEGLVRKFFNSKVRQAFVKNHQNTYSYEGEKDCFMIAYQINGKLKDRLTLLANAMRIFNDIVPRDSDEMLS